MRLGALTILRVGKVFGGECRPLDYHPLHCHLISDCLSEERDQAILMERVLKEVHFPRLRGVVKLLAYSSIAKSSCRCIYHKLGCTTSEPDPARAKSTHVHSEALRL